MTTTTTAALTRDELAERAFDLIAIEARRFRSLPPGVNTDDLESVGGEALLVATAEYDGPADEWRSWVKFRLRNRMQAFVTAARKRSGRHTTLEVMTPTGESFPRADPRTADPAELAAVREKLKRPAGPVRAAVDSLPSPAAVADRVSKLRDALYGAVDVTKLAAMVGVLQDQAVGGDQRAMKLLIDLLSPARNGVVVQQQVVSVRSGDLD